MSSSDLLKEITNRVQSRRLVCARSSEALLVARLSPLELSWAVELGGTVSGGGDGSERAASQSQVRITALQAVGPDTI